MSADERIALFLDYENLAIGARDGLGVDPFDFGPVADALAERGRVVARRAYADWSSFGEDRRLLTRAQVELIEMPQRMGGARKNAADIKMAVDAIELAYERPFVTTFAIGTGDSDFTPLVHKLRELDKRVIGIGVASSTSALLPPACDEFLFYDRLPGIDATPIPRRRRGSRPAAATPPEPATSTAATSTTAAAGAAAAGSATTPTAGAAATPTTEVPAVPATTASAASAPAASASAATTGRGSGGTRTAVAAPAEPDTVDPDGADAGDRDVERLLTDTLAGLARHTDGPVLASALKRAMLRKDPTFDEADEGFRGFGELLRHLEGRRVVALRDGSARGDPEVTFPERGADEDAFALLVDTVTDLRGSGGPPQLSGLKDKLRKRQADFSEKRFGFRTFLAFVKAARARDLVDMRWDDAVDDYVLDVPSGG